MADVGDISGLDPGTQSGNDPATQAAYDQAAADAILQSKIDSGGNITGNQPSGPNPYDPNIYSGGGYYGSAKYAPYDEGSGHTKWDEFVQQMAYNNAKLAQDKALEEERLKNAVDVENIRAQEQKYGTDTTAVSDFDKDLFAAKGPADPYGYLFQSRGLASPQGYAPTAMPLAQGVRDAYAAQGVNLADAQKSIVGSSGPSFINGMLGSVSPQLQQGPMGFQNTPAFTNTAPGSQPQPQNSPSQPAHAAQGLMVPGYSPGHDTVPAMLSPGEGVLKPQAVKAMGGPQAINAINAQHFANGGIVTPTAEPAYSDTAPVPSWLFSSPAFGGQSNVTSTLAPGVQTTASGQPVTGESYNSPWGYSGNQWIPFNIGGKTEYGFAPDFKQTGTGYQLAGQNVGQNSWENAPPQGYSMQTPGVATRDQRSGGPTGMASFQPGQIDYVQGPRGIDPGAAALQPQWGLSGMMPQGGGPSQTGSGNDWVGQVEQFFGLGQGGQPEHNPMTGMPVVSNPVGAQTSPSTPSGPLQHGTPPIPFQPLGAPPPVGSGNTSGGNPAGNPNSPLLTGGVLTPPAPATGSPINLNNLDPYTRSLVDQYGRPQIPSAAAWNSMPQSGQQAYQNYVEKVAGGNFQDLLDQQKQTAPQGDAAALRDTLSFNS